MDNLAQHIEVLIFTSPDPISFEEISTCLETTLETTFTEEALLESIDEVVQKYRQDDFAFEILEIAGGYQFLSKGLYHKTVGTFLKQTSKKRLSKAALETLSIIAYKQPVTKSELEQIRGVSCDYSMQKLLEKELVTIQGRSPGPGRPLIYATSEKFMDYFGLKDISELPKLKDFKAADNEIGEAAPIDEVVNENGETEVDRMRAAAEGGMVMHNQAIVNGIVMPTYTGEDEETNQLIGEAAGIAMHIASIGPHGTPFIIPEKIEITPEETATAEQSAESEELEQIIAEATGIVEVSTDITVDDVTEVSDKTEITDETTEIAADNPNNPEDLVVEDDTDTASTATDEEPAENLADQEDEALSEMIDDATDIAELSTDVSDELDESNLAAAATDENSEIEATTTAADDQDEIVKESITETIVKIENGIVTNNSEEE